MSGSGARYSARWWRKDEVSRDRVHEVLVSLVRKLEQRQDLRRRMDLLHMTLYADMPVSGLGPFAYTKLENENDGTRLNLCKSATDSFVAMLSRTKPKPMCLTDGGDWSTKRRGKGLTKWLEGMFEQCDVRRELSSTHARIAAVTGTSLLHVFADVPSGEWDEATVGLASGFPWESTVDEAEAQDPRNMRSFYRHRWMDRFVLAEMFPKKKAEIFDAPSRADEGAAWGQDLTNDLIRVDEGWHLRSSRVADDGLRAVCIQNATLATEPWELDRFPFAVLRRARAPMGFYGIGIPQELRGIQTTINEITLAYEEAMIFFARPKWSVPRGANVQRAHLDDQIGSIIEFDGPLPPQMYVANQVMPADVFQYLWQLWQKGYEQIGVPQMFSAGQVPVGLKSGEAIRRYNDTGNARFVEQLQNFEEWHVEIAELMIEVGREIAKRNPKFASYYLGGSQRELVYFDKVDPGRDKFTLRVHPTSALSTTPSERLEQLDELYQRKLIDDATFRILLDWPDLQSENDLVSAPYQIVEKLIERFLDADEDEIDDAFVSPDPDWPLEYMRARVQFAAALAYLQDAPEANVALLHRFADACQARMKAAAPPAPTPMPGAPPGAAPPSPGAGPAPAGPPMPPPGAAPPLAA